MANGNNGFDWDAHRDHLHKLAHDIALAHRVMRPLLTLYGEQGKWTRNIFRNVVVAAEEESPTISLDDQNLTPVTLSYDFTVERELFGDRNVLEQHVKLAASRIAAAEDAVILLGKEAKGRLNRVNAKHLDQQSGLWHPAPNTMPAKRSVADSAREGFADQALLRCSRRRAGTANPFYPACAWRAGGR
jgi:hypothetical protein